MACCARHLIATYGNNLIIELISRCPSLRGLDGDGKTEGTKGRWRDSEGEEVGGGETCEERGGQEGRTRAKEARGGGGGHACCP